VRSASQEKGVYFEDGLVIHAESNQREDGLAHYLLDLGSVDVALLEAALKQVAPGRQLGTILLEMGAFSEQELNRARLSLVERIVVSVFELEQGTYLFQTAASPSPTPGRSPPT